MHPRAAEIVAAVRACLGTPFRPLGRRPGLGLDCLGVALVAAEAAGAALPAVPRYALGGDHEAALCAGIASAGLVAVGAGAPGDVLLFALADNRRHFAVQTGPGPVIVHAHAGLGVVVEGPADPAWTCAGAWRFA